MSNFDKFRDLGMEVIESKPTLRNCTDDVVLKIVCGDTTNKGAACVSILKSTYEIAFGDVNQRLRFIVAPKTDRIYLVPDDNGSKFTGGNKRGNRCYAYSKPLSAAMKKWGYCKIYNTSIKFDKDLNAYYFEVSSIRK